MAFGFPAQYRERYIPAYPSERIRAAVRESLKALGWPLTTDAYSIIRAALHASERSGGEIVTIYIGPGDEVLVVSKCARRLRCFDGGRNRDNVRALMEEIRKRA